MNIQRLVFGVGINDAGYPVTKYSKVDGINRQIWICPFYSAWRKMLERCYSAKYHERKPTYVGCSVFDPWLRFSCFMGWMESKDWNGNALDKDLIVNGNKIYSPDTCAFITPGLNNFLSDRLAKRGEHPIGVNWDRNAKKFKSQCRNPFSGSNDHLGLFDSAERAHKAWLIRKQQHAYRYADMQNDTRIAKALRNRFVIHSGQLEAGNLK